MWTCSTCQAFFVPNSNSRQCLLCRQRQCINCGITFEKSAKSGNTICRSCKPTYAIKKAQLWYASNKEKKKLYDEKRRLEKRILYRLASQRWRKNNPGKKNADTAERRASQSQRTPAWADLQAIKAFYEQCPPGYHVDHIIPLRGKYVSGLHVLENLQYLPGEENLKKLNHYSLFHEGKA